MSKPAVLLVLAAALVATGFSGVAAAAPATPAGPTRDVIVLLRDQHPDIPATPGQAGQRRAVLGADQAAEQQRVTHLGGRTTHTYAAVNAVAATVPTSALAALAADPAVAEVVPDLAWHASSAGEPAAASTARPAATAPPAGVCPTDPSRPLLEPEALGQTHTDADGGTAPTARSLGFDGTGVKVGFIADGVDVDQPDYIRADGSHVFTDYQDFSGDGTTSSSPGAEALGDASSIAAQGRVAYDLADFVNPAHALPTGCTIRVEGMAPGASLVGLKIFANALFTAPTSTIVQAIDYAVSVDHVDVLNESFGSNPYPDNATDPISVFNRDAVDAGVTVVASSGDAGFGNTMGTAATDPWVIGVGASTQFQSYLQTGRAGVQLGNGTVSGGNPSSISSSGIAQTGRVVDLLAPGDLGWATCSFRKLADGSPQYTGCTNYAGQPSNLQLFGGTSESSPLAAGAAALVIQAFRRAHHGRSPTPQQVRLALDSGADDLGLPAEDQGSGLLNSYRSVQIAQSLGTTAAPHTQGLVLDQPYLSSTTTPSATVTSQAVVTNSGTGTQRVSATTRRVDTVAATTTQSLTLSAAHPSRTFTDSLGTTRSYVRTTFTVAPGTDLLVASIGVGAAGQNVRMSLLDPQGTFSAFTLPQGDVGFGEVERQHPAAGTWTAIVFTTADTGYSGPVRFRATGYHATTAGTVSPASFTLAPGAHQRVTVTSTAPSDSAAAASVVFTGNSGLTTTLPVVIEAVQPVSAATPASFTGAFDDGNGRDSSPADSETYRFAVPAGAAAFDLDLAVAGGSRASGVVAHLSDPSGEPVATVSNQHPDGSTVVTDPGLQIRHVAPTPGVWQLTLELLNPVSGPPLPRAYRGTVSLDRAPVTTTGVPTGQAAVSRSAGARATVTVTNDGPAPQTFFVDPRTTTTTTYPLVAVGARTTRDPYTAAVALPRTSDDVPSWIVPTGSSRLVVGASATEPTAFDVMPLDSPTALNAPNNPDVEASVSGNGATAVHAADPVASALWAAFPTVIGPVPAAGAPAGTVSMQASVDTLTFDGDVTSSTGDPMLATVRSRTAATHAVTVAPGQSATITVRITPSGAVGSHARGTLFLDVLTPGGADGNAGYADAVAAVPYAYVVTT